MTWNWEGYGCLLSDLSDCDEHGFIDRSERTVWSSFGEWLLHGRCRCVRGVVLLWFIVWR